MKTIIAVILGILFPVICFGITEYRLDDKLFIWAESGLNLRQSADSKSKVIINIPFGKKVVCQGFKSSQNYENSSQKIIDKVEINGGKYAEILLKGSWVKVKFGKHEGFVFDSYLSRFKPISIENLGLLNFFSNSCDSLLYIEKKDSSLNHGRDKIVFCNGIFMTRNYHKGAYWFQMNIPDFSVEEAFLIIKYLEKHILEINQEKGGKIHIGQELRGFKIESYKNFVIISGEWWSC